MRMKNVGTWKKLTLALVFAAAAMMLGLPANADSHGKVIVFHVPTFFILIPPCFAIKIYKTLRHSNFIFFDICQPGYISALPLLSRRISGVFLG
jgi:hypothetical protein